MKEIHADIAIVGAGGGGLRSAIASAEKDPTLKIALISKVYPMRSHTVAAEGGAAGVKQAHDTLDNHFNDTVSGSDWLAEQDVVDYFVHEAPKELEQLERWGCPWSRKEDGDVNVRAFGGMKVERTWFAADKTGFHILHTLFQTSIQFKNIERFDEFFVLDLLVEDGKVRGVVCVELATGEFYTIYAPSVIMATGGGSRVFRFNTNGGIVTGDGLSMCYRHGAPLRDMEFVQYHPTGLPGTGILMTEGCRGEGGLLRNKDGRRYLQDYGLGPATPEPKNKYMELGPRDRLSQAFWAEDQKGNTIDSTWGKVVHLDLTHLGEKKLKERLPFICELAEAFVQVNPVKEPIPVRPVVHYTMGGIEVNQNAETRIKGLFAVGECSSSGLHGANRLGSNSLTELLVFGRVAGEKALEHAKKEGRVQSDTLKANALKIKEEALEVRQKNGKENPGILRKELTLLMERGAGIYRTEALMQKAIEELFALKVRFENIGIKDKSEVFNTDWLGAIELRATIDVAESMLHSAILRRESRGSHQRLDEGCQKRDDQNFLKHSLAFYAKGEAPRIEYSSVKITKSQPAERLYGAAGDKEKETKE